MRFPEVKKELKSAYEEFLKPEGFKSKKHSTGSEFTKSIKHLKLLFGYSVTNFYDVFYTGFYFYIANEKLNNIKENIRGTRSLFHINIYSSSYFNKTNFDYEIKTENDINEWLIIVKKFYYEFAKCMVEKFESSESLEMYLNRDPKALSKYYQAYEGRIENGLILSKLIKPQNYEKLKQTYLEDLELKKIVRQEALKRGIVTTEDYNPFESIYKTIEFLDRHSSEDLQQMLNRHE